jgi:hypothetical protein
MILKSACSRIAVCITVFFSAQFYSQLVGTDTQIWEKANTSLREVSDVKQDRLLNFHDGIKNRFLKNTLNIVVIKVTH